MVKRRGCGLRHQPQSVALTEPVGLKVGVGCLRGAGAGDGDDVSFRIGEGWSVCLKVRAESSADEVAVVSLFRGAFAGDEGGSQGGQRGIGQGANNDKPACFRVAGFSDADKIRVMGDAALSREPHGESSYGVSGWGEGWKARALDQVPCCVMWRLK